MSAATGKGNRFALKAADRNPKELEIPLRPALTLRPLYFESSRWLDGWGRAA